MVPGGVWALVAVAAALLALGYLLPFWSASNGLVGREVALIDEDDSWPFLGVAVLVALGAFDLFRRRTSGLSVVAGGLLQWAPFMLILMAFTDELSKQAESGGYSSGSVSYGTGGILWILALLVVAAVIIVAVVHLFGDRSPVQASPALGLVVLAAGLAAVLAFMGMGSDHTDPVKYLTEDALSGPFLADVAIFGWLGGLTAASVIAFVRRTPDAFGIVAGLSVVWLMWGVAGDTGGSLGSAGLVDSGALFVLSVAAAGTAAAVGVVSPRLASASLADDVRTAPLSAVATVVLVPVLALAALAS